LPYKHGCR